MRQPRRRRWLERLLLIGFMLCLLIGLAALALLWNVYQGGQQPSLADEPLVSVRSDLILAPLALAQLSGDPAEALAFQALQAGHLETSRAILSFSSEINGSAHLGLLTQLARRYLDNGQREIASLLSQQMRDSALLDNSLNTIERSQALQQAAANFLLLDDQTAALDSAIQAQRVIEQSPNLLPAQRSQLFQTLHPLADKLEDPRFRQEIAELLRNPFVAPQGMTVTVRLSQVAESLPWDEAVSTARSTRQQRARELADRIAFTGGADIDPERQALAQALRSEDLARAEYARRLLAGGMTLPQQIWLSQEQREWQLTKLRIATGGFGLTIVPEWDGQRLVLLREVGALTTHLDNLLHAWVNGQEQNVEQSLLRFEVRSWLALQHQRGLYPGIAADDLGRRFEQVQAELQQRGSMLALPIVYDPPLFRFQALPR
jgi:hypothetical protein